MPAVSDSFTFESDHDSAQRYWYLPSTVRPPQASTQWLAFRFRLDGMQRHSFESHFAVVLRARLGFDERGTPVSISGRGITLGNTSLAQPPADNPHAHAPGFGGALGTQVESFWPGGNFLYRDAALLPEGLRDDQWYRVWLHVNDERWIAFGCDPEGDEPRAALHACVQDRASHPVIGDATGVLIGLGRGPSETGPWRAEFRDLSSGWF